MDACDLAACPVCGKAVFENHSEVFCGDELCVYMTATVDLHNTLARRAEIGRLVESIGATGRDLTISPISLGHPDVYARARTKTKTDSSEAASLLEALRALTAEIGENDVG